MTTPGSLPKLNLPHDAYRPSARIKRPTMTDQKCDTLDGTQCWDREMRGWCTCGDPKRQRARLVEDLKEAIAWQPTIPDFGRMRPEEITAYALLRKQSEEIARWRDLTARPLLRQALEAIEGEATMSTELAEKIILAIETMMAKLTPEQWEDEEFMSAAAIVWDAAKKQL